LLERDLAAGLNRNFARGTAAAAVEEFEFGVSNSPPPSWS
jgi:hypothetical protein